MSFLKRFVTLILGAGLLVSGTAAQLWAQNDRGTIVGTVTDPSGSVIVGASVTATNTGTKVPTQVSSSASGHYTIPLLQVGKYDVTVEQTGFKKYVQTGVVVDVAQTVRVDVAMQIGEATQAVEVTAQGTEVQIQRDTSDRGTVISGQEVLDLPLVTQSEQRNPALFITLAPGVNSRGTVTSTPSGSGRQLNTTVNGSQSEQH
jgi:Carboxypeptidase regulatory-like domain